MQGARFRGTTQILRLLVPLLYAMSCVRGACALYILLHLVRCAFHLEHGNPILLAESGADRRRLVEPMIC